MIYDGANASNARAQWIAQRQRPCPAMPIGYWIANEIVCVKRKKTHGGSEFTEKKNEWQTISFRKEQKKRQKPRR